MARYVVGFEEVGLDDLPRVGGKNASLGEMIRRLSPAGLRVPPGFATTSEAYRDFFRQGGLDRRVEGTLAGLDVDDVGALGRAAEAIRGWMLETPLPGRLATEIVEAYERLGVGGGETSVAVRSSSTAEDLATASFAGQQETLLNIRGSDALLRAVRRVLASLYSDRAIAYRAHQGVPHEGAVISVGVQRMVRTDLGASGVMFTLDTESGFRDVILINAAYGLGETVVQGAINPDEYVVHKPALRNGFRATLRRTLGAKAVKMIYADGADPGATTKLVDVPEEDRRRFCLREDEVEALARQALIIEDHYGRPMDIEWGKDGVDGRMYILQARPETVKSAAAGHALERYRLAETGKVLVTGRSIGTRIGAGVARVIRSAEGMSVLRRGEVLVTDMTDPDWEPVMKRAAAIVTDRGGRTCHAAIIARELGIPAVVGTGNATRALKDGEFVTVSCAEGDEGRVYEGKLRYEVIETRLEDMPALPFKIMMNVGNPEGAFGFQALPNAGVGLARLEFIINRSIGVHPKAILDYPSVPDDVRREIERRAEGYENPVSFFAEKLAEGIATIAAAFSPKPVIVRLSDFKSNEYGELLGGRAYEPREENPMLGLRGASRYVALAFRSCFELECRALRRVRDDMGFVNVAVMVPFVRTVAEGRDVVELLARNGLERGRNGLRVIMMCEVPSNALLADQFLEHFDGFSIGSNDLTQLTLGLDRDSGLVAPLFDERDEAVKFLLHRAIEACRKKGKYIGICGQGPSDHPDLARWLMEEGIDSISLNPDTVVSTWLFLAGQNP